MKLSNFTKKQLDRIYRKLYNRVQQDMFGTDWSTLKITNPSLYNSLKDVYQAIQEIN